MTGSLARAAAAYQEVQITSRSPLELVVMLYDGALDALRKAHAAMASRDLVAKRDAIRKALAIVQHLQSSLNMADGGEVSANLDSLYHDVIARVVDANVHTNAETLDEAIRLLATVREAWGAIASAQTTAPALPPTGTLDAR